MSEAETAVVTEVLTTMLGTTPTADEVLSGTQDALVMARVLEILNKGTGVHSVAPGDDLQEAIDDLAEDGTGILHLQAGTFTLTSDITIPSGINLQGTGTSTIIDFDNEAYQFQIVGTDVYTTGTISITPGSTAVVGGSTVFYSGMIGEHILLQDNWYEIVAVTDDTHLTIISPYFGTTLSSATYVISTIVDGVEISGMTIKNSGTASIKIQYCLDVRIEDVIFLTNTSPIDADDSSGLQILNSRAFGNTTAFTFNNIHNTTWLNSGSFGCAGNGLELTSVRNCAFDVFAFEGNGGKGMVLTDVDNTGFDNFSVRGNVGIGVELVSGCTLGMSIGEISYNGSDGVKYTASNTRCILSNINLEQNGGYGVNIAASSNNMIVVSLNTFDSNASGHINDLGTDTVLGPNGVI